MKRMLALVTKLNHHSNHMEKKNKSDKKMKEPILCPGCIFGMWYSWGIISEFSKDNIFHASSGSVLAVICYLCNLDVQMELKKCASLRNQLFKWKLYSVIRQWLVESLPENAHLLCKNKLTILVRSFPTLKITGLNEWSNKEELIDATIASCSILCVTKFRNKWYTDCIYIPMQHYKKIIKTTTVIYPPNKAKAKQLYDDGKNQITKFV